MNFNQQFQQQQRQQQRQRQMAGYAWQQRKKLQRQQEQRNQAVHTPVSRKPGGFVVAIKFLFIFIAAGPIMGFIGWAIGISVGTGNDGLDVVGAIVGVAIAFFFARWAAKSKY